MQCEECGAARCEGLHLAGCELAEAVECNRGDTVHVVVGRAVAKLLGGAAWAATRGTRKTWHGTRKMWHETADVGYFGEWLARAPEATGGAPSGPAFLYESGAQPKT